MRRSKVSTSLKRMFEEDRHDVLDPRTGGFAEDVLPVKKREGERSTSGSAGLGLTPPGSCNATGFACFPGRLKEYGLSRSRWQRGAA
jgi:hypothetical protein